MRRQLPLAVFAALLATLPTATVAAQEKAGERSVDVSGIIFGNFQYHVEPGHDSAADEQVRAGLDRNQFAIERLYLTVRSTLNPRTSVRATAELFNDDGAYGLRVKYGYLDYRFVDNEATTAFVRAGLLQNIMVDHEERFWPRYVANAPLARAGYFSSADLGVAVGASLPRDLGEVYAEVVDGRGYQGVGSADDRFKDFGARLTLTPFVGSPAARVLGPLVVSPWYYRGDTASVFGPGSRRADAPGYLGPLDSGRRRDRYGLFAAWDDPRLQVGVSMARRRSEVEGGANTPASPATTTTRTGELLGAFAVVRPLAFADSAGRSPLAILLRYDRDDPNTDVAGHVRYVVAGVAYDLTPDVSVALDYQETMPRAGQPPTRGNLRQVYYARFQARF